MLLLETGPQPRDKHTTASWRVELHLHFLIFYFLKKKKQNKTDYRLKRRRKTTVDLTLNIFNFPLDFFFFVFVISSDWLHSGGRKRETKSAHFLCLDWNKPICCWVFWTLNPVLYHVSHVKAYQVLVQIRARRRENQHAQCTDIPTCTHTYTHTKYILCTSTYTKT